MPAGRFAPSPTGPLHLGSLRTAIIAWLCARSSRSRFLVRVEDLDPVASRDEHVAGHLADLTALGVDWDGQPVRQSERLALYRDALSELGGRGLLYRCWCTRREIQEAATAPHGPLPEGGYPGTCLSLTAAQIRDREESGRRPALRVRADGAVGLAYDRLHGPIEGVVDDFVVRRNDGAPAYNLAVVVDDADQHVDEVVRGRDLLDSTPRQAWLAGLLGLPTPAYVHVPLVLGPDGVRLAKRHGAVTLAEQLAMGRSAAEVRDLLTASLGLEPGPLPALVGEFDPARLPRDDWRLEPHVETRA